MYSECRDEESPGEDEEEMGNVERVGGGRDERGQSIYDEPS